MPSSVGVEGCLPSLCGACSPGEACGRWGCEGRVAGCFWASVGGSAMVGWSQDCLLGVSPFLGHLSHRGPHLPSSPPLTPRAPRPHSRWRGGHTTSPSAEIRAPAGAAPVPARLPAKGRDVASLGAGSRLGGGPGPCANACSSPQRRVGAHGRREAGRLPGGQPPAAVGPAGERQPGPGR